MSFFKKLFGGQSFEDERKRADELYDAKQWGEAKLAYEALVGRAPDDVIEDVRRKLVRSYDKLALVHYKEADTYRKDPSITLASSTFESVTCYSSTDLVNWKFEADVLTCFGNIRNASRHVFEAFFVSFVVRDEHDFRFGISEFLNLVREINYGDFLI